ncbi:Aminoglycoside phosphotransferase [Marinibacterium anthonyi]|nr:Aminoglycoside phosphotransferase [Marinibacterium anthonyi]
MHQDEIPVSTALAARLVDRGMPQWAGQPVRPLAATGTDNWMFRLGGDKVLRLPRRPSAVMQLRREWDWLPHLRGLPLAVPEPLALGEPDDGYPHPWMVLSWLPGETLHARPPANTMASAEALGNFLTALRDLSGEGGPIAGSTNHNRGVPLTGINVATRQAIGDIARQYPVATLMALWDDALAAPSWSGAPLWVHGDLSPTNLLCTGGRLSSVIDFGLIARGDPAVDLTPAWSVFDGAARSAFLSRAGIDAATIRRGKGWALYGAVINLAYYGDNHPTLSRQAHHVLDVLMDEA